jgi:uncharacterized protein (UPF0332 family)
MFYVAQASLESKGLSFSKHSAVVSGFGQHFVKTGDVPAEYHRYLIEAMDVRHQGDYASGQCVSSELAATQIGRAASFVQRAEEHLDSD